MDFALPIRIYWEDTDAGGVVFYANYLRFYERARTEWLRSLGIEQQKLREQTGGMFVVTQAQVEYLRPARLDDQLLVTARLEASGRASMTIRQQAFLETTSGALLSEASIRIGWVNGANIPISLLEQLS